ncbi:MAG: DUF3078 domain-containing protein, partial [Cytophagales bacterium]|nr:DUF3078 domain-containing protein [Cytophagales bacterium]
PTPKSSTDTSYWKTSLQTGINVNQASFSTNWKAGGTNSFALGVFLNGKANYLKENWSWDNDLQLQYGLLNTQQPTSRWTKTTDRIYLDSKVGYSWNKSWSFFGSLTFMSQFAPGLKYVKNAAGTGDTALYISSFLSPGYLSEALGVEYKPVDFWFVRFGLGGVRQTFVIDQNVKTGEPSNYGVTTGTLKNELGLQILSKFDKDILKNVNLKVQFLGFVNYAKFDNFVNRTDFILTAKVTKYISTNLTAVLFRDSSQDVNYQWSQALSLGILYTFEKPTEKK